MYFVPWRGIYVVCEGWSGSEIFFFKKVREVKKENLSVLCVTVNPDLITLRDLIEHFSLFCYLCRE